ncbi:MULTISPECIES: hypothetical protein [unclassified Nocardioides]|uniref:hypothetical protein n=1 Tax=unclassified Nocardioides TaxID=2615069 RepID=UPI001E43B10A|nr:MULTISPECIES: hypothetical protein [unclassified Nocardioides]MCD4526406.1 hypothetical protein [Nocardioides sp. cx-173]MCD4534827.1 hypothetical protein [Nocardioides sp. cx-169]UGB43576.1 hypothetical protein LQ940_08625 [Nocardioides sp. cx-173]
MLTNSLVTLIATMVVGGAVGAAAIVGLVSSQTAAPDKSPASVEKPVIQYGE